MDSEVHGTDLKEESCLKDPINDSTGVSACNIFIKQEPCDEDLSTDCVPDVTACEIYIKEEPLDDDPLNYCAVTTDDGLEMSSENNFDLSGKEGVADLHSLLHECESEGDDRCSEDENELIPDFADEDVERLTSESLISYPEDGSDSSESTEDIEELTADEQLDDSILQVEQVPTKLKGKNGFLWAGKKEKIHKTPTRNNVTFLQGNRNEAKNVTSGIDAWELCFTGENLDDLVTYTNQEMLLQREKYRNDKCDDDPENSIPSVGPSFTRDTNIMEMKALIGLLYYAGVMKVHGLRTRELFDKDTGIPIFRATMAEARFSFLLHCLRFDDKKSRSDRKRYDKLAAFRDVFERSVTKMQTLYHPSEHTTIDELLVGFRGRCPFKVYSPLKPDKHGIKIIMCCDAKTYYVVAASVYTGKGSTPADVPIAQHYCEKLTSSFHGTNRNLTADNRFTSIHTAKILLEKKITVVGPLKQNKSEIPPLFLNRRKRKRNSVMFAYNDEMTLLSYCPPRKQKKVVVMVSTLHDKGDDPKEKKRLPDIIDFYNRTKGGVDVFDRLCHTYTTARKTRRWSLRLFYNLLDIVGINSMILLKGSHGTRKERIVNRRTYLKKLANDLIRPHMTSRLLNPTLTGQLRDTITRVLNIKPNLVPAERNEKCTGRCSFCPRSRDRKTRVKCEKCKRFICLEHQKRICPSCS